MEKSYLRQWELTTEGTRYSKEFTFFLKKLLDTYPIPAQFLERYYHIDGIQLERHSKEHLNGYLVWKEKAYPRVVDTPRKHRRVF